MSVDGEIRLAIAPFDRRIQSGAFLIPIFT